MTTRSVRSVRLLALPTLAAVGLAVAVIAIVGARQAPTTAKPLSEPASAPYASYVGGTGQLEPPGRPVGIGAYEGGIVVDVPIKVGDQVRAGAVLFRLDDRVRKAERQQRI